MRITPIQLSTIAAVDEASAQLWARILSATINNFELATPQRAAAFLAQTAHASDGFSRTEEDLSYSAARLRATWPQRFYLVPELVDERLNASDFALQPEGLANLIYANRMGNGPYESGDGWRFRGRGLLKIAGRRNYHLVGRALGADILNSPYLLSAPTFAASSAAVLWNSHELSHFADYGNVESFRKISQILHHGPDDLENLERLWFRAHALLEALPG